MKTYTYADQVRARADRATHLEQENEALRAELRTLKDEAKLRELLKEIVDAAPNCRADWQRPTAWTGFTVEEYDWTETTPERFEAAIYKAWRYFNPTNQDEAPV